MDFRKIAGAAVAAVCIAAPLAAQTVTPATAQTTPTNGQWALVDGKDCPGGTCPGPDPATIVSTPTVDGDGSLQFQLNSATEQPAAYYQLTTPISLSAFLSGGYSYYGDPSQSGGDPVYRLDLIGISDEGAHQTGSGYGSMGFIPPTDAASWSSATFAQNAGDFFFRVGGSGNGQVADGCSNTSYAGSFSDREQTIGTWLSECTGSSGTVDLATAYVSGVQVDYGTFPGQSTTTTTYADNVAFDFTGGPSGDYDFATATTVVPEPGTMSLLAFGLVGLAGMKRRKRSK